MITRRQCIPQVKLLYPDLTKRDISVSAIFGYYSRSSNTTEELTEKAWDTDKETDDYVYKSFIKKWILGYKHNSLSEHPSLHFYVENISNIATKILEANSMGQNGVPVAYMEKSTRYVNMENAKVFNMIPRYFNTLENEKDKVFDDFEKRFDKIIEKEISMYNHRLKLYEEICDKNGVPKSKAFDSAREYLPAGISTIVGVSLNVRAAKEVIVNLLSNGNCEAYIIGEQLLELCLDNFGTIFNREEIMSRVSERAHLLRKSISDVYKGENSRANVFIGHIHPNYKFLKSIKPNELIDFELIRNHILFETFDENDISFKKISNIIDKKDKQSATVSLKRFEDVHTSIKNVDGDIQNSINILNYISSINAAGVKVNVNDIPEDAFNNSVEVEIKADYGSYRDIARHRKLKFLERDFYSHSLSKYLYINESNDTSEFFTYYLEGIITDSPFDSELTRANKASLQFLTYKYYIELTLEILDLIVDMRKMLLETNHDKIESNVLLLEALSYLLPMSIEKWYDIKCSLPDLLHLVQERIQPAGHLYYRSVASSIWVDVEKQWNSPEFIKIVNHMLSYLKDSKNGAGSIWKDVCLQIEDMIIEI